MVLGKNNVDFGGTPGTAGHRWLAKLPPTGYWVRIRIPASLVNLEKKMITGMSFSVVGGRAFFDNTTLSDRTTDHQRNVWAKVPPLAQRMASNSTATFSFRLSKPTQVSYKIIPKGTQKAIRHLAPKAMTVQHPLLSWDGRDDQKQLVPEGEYRIVLTARSGKETTSLAATFRFSSLIAQIRIPWKPLTIVRATLPIFGTASGREFAKYILSYGKGWKPTTWKKNSH